MTPRDKLDRLLQYVDRAKRYWWLVAGLVVLGGVLSVGFALTRPKVYQSGAVLYYQEHLQTNLLQNRDVSAMQRNIGERYRELLLARSSLVNIIRDPKINPFPEILASDGEDVAVEALRDSISFLPRGANTFIIAYRDTKPRRAQQVTQKLAELLKAKEAGLRLEQSQATADFANKLLLDARDELHQRQRKLNEFLVAHPEFAIDAAQGQGEGAGIRALQDKDSKKPKTAAELALVALERQRARIKARIANPAAPPPPEPRAPRVRTAEQIAADAKVADAQRELDAAEKALADARRTLQDQHPDVVRLSGKVETAKQRLAAARAAVPPDVAEPDLELPTGPVDPAVLQKELADIERQIADAQAKAAAGAGAGSDKPQADWVVKLEDDYQALKLNVDEQREEVQARAKTASSTQLDAEQRAADQGGSLTVVDEANRPLKPIGKGKRLVVMAGTFLFGLLGCGLALGLAILDDRIYGRPELADLGVGPVLAVIPRARVARRKREPKREMMTPARS